MQVARYKRTFAKKQDQRIDRISSAAFQTAMQDKTYFGPVYFVRGSEPYIGLAVSIEQLPGNVIGVLRAEVDLRYVGEVISAIKAGNSGYAYVVTRSGELIAHPDIGLVLQRTRLADLDQVKSAFLSTQGARTPKPLVALNLQGQKIFSSSAVIPGLNWAVIVERPVSEAYESTLRAGELAEVTTFYRNDLAFAEDNRLPTNPHDFMRRVDQPLELARQIANGAQDQIAVFLRSGAIRLFIRSPRDFLKFRSCCRCRRVSTSSREYEVVR